MVSAGHKSLNLLAIVLGEVLVAIPKIASHIYQARQSYVLQRAVQSKMGHVAVRPARCVLGSISPNHETTNTEIKYLAPFQRLLTLDVSDADTWLLQELFDNRNLLK